MKVQLTPMEERVKNIYLNELNISIPSEIDLYLIAEKLGVWVHERNGPSKLLNRFMMPTILLNVNLNYREQWYEFGHEFGHYNLHVRNQSDMNDAFRVYQEKQAEEFAFDFCAPTFMLLKQKNLLQYPVEFIYDNFPVTKEFAKRKANYLRQKVNQAQRDEMFKQTLNQRRSMSQISYPQKKYSEETLRILNKLNKQIGAISQ